MNSSAPGNAERQGLAARFAGGPHVSASSNAEQVLEDWLSELEPEHSAALDALLEHPFAKTILAGIAEFSPYLFELVRADAARLIRVLSCEPEAHLSSLIENTTRDVFAAPRRRRLSPAARDGLAAGLSRRRLDRHRMARHHGGRGA